MIDEFDQAMTNIDVILTATTPSEAPKIDAVSKFAILERPLLTMPFNVTGSPAISICCGFTKNATPLSSAVYHKLTNVALYLL